MVPFFLLYSVDAHFGMAASGDAEIPILGEISEEEEEQKLMDKAREVSSTQAKPKVPRK